jgi:Ni,Fe-hydrogenase maturation factor
MAQRIVIDPVTRIEGHAKIGIMLDDSGNVSDAQLHVTEFRGFEKFCESRPMSELAGITPRICGICPISHVLTSAKAGDAILAVKIPPAADKLRRLINLGLIIQSHALSFFHLSAPDFLIGWDSAPEKRNVFGLAASNPDVARRGIRLRQFGQEIIETLGGKKIHPAWAGSRRCACHQLTPELAEAIASAGHVVFVDAALGPDDSVKCREIEPDEDSQVMTHATDPRSLVTLARQAFGRCPTASCLTIPIQDIDFGEELSTLARNGFSIAPERIRSLAKSIAC